MSATLLGLILLLGATPISAEQYESNLRAGVRVFETVPRDTVAMQYVELVSPTELMGADGLRWTVRDPWLESAVRLYAQARDEPGDKARTELAHTIAEHLEARAAEIDGATLSTEQPAVPAGTPSPDTLDQILQAEQYQEPSQPPALVEIAARIRIWMKARWEDIKAFFRRIFGGEQDASAWETIRSLLTLLATVIALIVIIYFAVKMLASSADLGVHEEGDPYDMPAEPPEPEPMAQEASDHAARGDLREAMRAIYLALLGRLHARQLIRYDRHRTNREYIRDLRARPEAQRLFAEAVDLFDPTWYGHRDCTPDQFARMQAIFEALATASSPAKGHAA